MTSTQRLTRQRAVQLIGRDDLFLREDKPVPCPGAHQILVKVEAVGLCCSDLALLAQFAHHPRKAGVTGGIDQDALAKMSNYVPDEHPSVPGHEAVVRVALVGPGVSRYREGERFLVQPYYRWLSTPKSSAAFGYNFEGALQEYVLLDERIIVGPGDETSMIAVPDGLSASALALVEPWSHIAASYTDVQRRSPKIDGHCVVVGETPQELEAARPQLSPSCAAFFTTAADIGNLKDNAFDDLLYFGSNAETVERLVAKLAPKGLLVICQCEKPFGKTVRLPIGRVHSDAIRLVGARSSSLIDAFANIPVSSEIHSKDRILVVGAAGPAGTMHVLNVLSQGLVGVSVYATDPDEAILNALEAIAEPVARANGCRLKTCGPSQNRLAGKFNRIVVLAPMPALIQDAVATSAERGIIDISADFPASVTAELDLDAYIEKRLYFVGAGSSAPGDMENVLAQIVSGKLDADLAVAAVSGLGGAIEGMRTLETNVFPGKIIIYPSCHGLPLTPLSEGKLLAAADRPWSQRAEQTLLEQWARPSRGRLATE